MDNFRHSAKNIANQQSKRFLYTPEMKTNTTRTDENEKYSHTRSTILVHDEETSWIFACRNDAMRILRCYHGARLPLKASEGTERASERARDGGLLGYHSSATRFPANLSLARSTSQAFLGRGDHRAPAWLQIEPDPSNFSVIIFCSFAQIIFKFHSQAKKYHISKILI
jgi:hypothetical protein